MLVQVQIGRQKDDAEARLHELKELCRTAGVRVTDVVVQKRHDPDPKTLIGRGKLEDIVLRALQDDATLLILDQDLTPAQARTIGDVTELKVIDRTMLILDIFAQHAHSRDGKLQVELAQLKYTLPRLQDKNTMMSRLTGGIGGRGPGETKLEINRRRAKEKLQLLDTQIQQLAKRRGERRKGPHEERHPDRRDRRLHERGQVDAAQHAHAGRSARRGQAVRPRSIPRRDACASRRSARSCSPIPSASSAICRRTSSPPFARRSRSSTRPDLLLHIVDGADPAHEAHIYAVDKILADLELGTRPRILVFNKTDRMTPEQVTTLLLTSRKIGEADPLAICAKDPKTLQPLFLAMEHALWSDNRLKDMASFERPKRDSAFGVIEDDPVE